MAYVTVIKVNVVSRSPSNTETLHELSAKRLQKKKKKHNTKHYEC